jgi:hypothetical protein
VGGGCAPWIRPCFSIAQTCFNENRKHKECKLNSVFVFQSLYKPLVGVRKYFIACSNLLTWAEINENKILKQESHPTMYRSRGQSWWWFNQNCRLQVENIKFLSSIVNKIIHTMVGIIISNSYQITDDERQEPQTDINTPPVTS